MRLLLQYFSNFLRKSFIRIQQGFQNCATRYLKQILPNVNTEFQTAECYYGTTFCATMKNKLNPPLSSTVK